MESNYDPRVYWEQRLSKEVDITTVGHQGLGYAYNKWLYRARHRAMDRALRTLKIDVLGKSVLELGVGSGAWIPFWQARDPARIVGVDITLASVDALAKQYPHLNFLQGDICSSLLLVPGGGFDLVTAMDVLFHITDDNGFSNAILNVARLMKQGGWAIITDSFCTTPCGPFFHEHHRTYDHYVKELSAMSLTPVHLEPIFFLMTTTLCTERRLFDRATRMILRLVSKLAARRQTKWLNEPFGYSLYFLDGVLRRIVKSGPSFKILFARKQ